MTNSEHPLSWKSLIRVVTMGLLVYLAWRALPVFINILVAIILATAVYPLVKKFHRKLPLLPSILITLLLILIPFALIGIFVVPNVVSQFPDLLNTLRPIVNNASFIPQSVKDFDIVSYLGQHTSEILASTKTAVLLIISSVEVFVLMFYFMLDHERLLGFFLDIFPPREQNKIKGVLTELAKVNGQYIRGNVLISLICAAILFIGLFVLRVPFALPLAILAGILDLLPLVGSTLGAIPALVVGFSISPLTGILVLALHLLYQQAENAIISPIIYNKSLNLSPALSFLSVVIGGALFGITGAFLALPVAASAPATIRYIREYAERNS